MSRRDKGTGEEDKSESGTRRPATVMWRSTVGSAALVLVSLTAAEAVHQVDHRYIVLGYVRDGGNRPVRGAPVRVVRARTGLFYDAETDLDGFYVVIVHLHDEDVLDILRVSTGRVTVDIEARFDPFDARTPRGTRVDFVGKKAVERQPAFAETLDAHFKR